MRRLGAADEVDRTEELAVSRVEDGDAAPSLPARHDLQWIEERWLSVDPKQRAVGVADADPVVGVGPDIAEEVAKNRFGDRERVSAPALCGLMRAQDLRSLAPGKLHCSTAVSGGSSRRGRCGGRHTSSFPLAPVPDIAHGANLQFGDL
jgi:hypothetical protein